MSSLLYSELDILNIIISMCLQQKAGCVDNVLYKEGYKITSIERSVATSVGMIKYDIMLSNKEKDYSIGIEIKGGKASNLPLEQLNRYEQLPASEYLSVGGAFYNDINQHQIQTIIAINNIRESEINNFLSQNHYNFPIMSFNWLSSVTVIANALLDNEIHLKFKDVIKFNGQPSKFIYFDKETKVHEMAPRLINKIYEYAKRGQDAFSIDSILNETYCTVPNLHLLIGTDIKKAVMRILKRVLKEMSVTELSPYIKWNGIEKHWEILKISTKSHFNTDIAFHQAGTNFVNRVKNNNPFKQSVALAGQLTIYEVDESLEETFI